MQRMSFSSSVTPAVDYWRDVHSPAWDHQPPPSSSKLVLATNASGNLPSSQVITDSYGNPVTDGWHAQLRCCLVPMILFYQVHSINNPSALPFIPFNTNESYARNLYGVAMSEAVVGRMLRADEEMRALRHAKIDFVLAWPGEKPWTKRIPVRTGFGADATFVTRQDLTRKIARAFREFIDFMGPSAYRNPIWSVQGGPIDIDVLRIVRLLNIHSETWVAEMAVMCY